jgi:hypothetical protein
MERARVDNWEGLLKQVMTETPLRYGEGRTVSEIDIVVPVPDRPAVRTPIWIVEVDGDLYIRSFKGEAGIWYRRARRHGTGSIVAAGREHQVDEAYRRKYGKSSYTQAMLRPPATTTTMRLDPA